MMRQLAIAVRIACSVFIASGIALASGLRGQGIQSVSIHVDDPRPLASAVAAIEKRFGWVVTYEEGPWLYQGDAVDVTSSVRTVPDPKRPPILIPRGGPYAFVRSFSSEALISPQGLLEALVEDYRSTGYPGAFRVVHTANVFHVVRASARNRNGAVVMEQPLLDTPISIPRAELTAATMTQAIVTAVAQVTGTKLDAVFPPNMFYRVQVSGGAANESARTVLVRVMNATQTRLSWALSCDPGARRECTLNIVFPDR